MNTPYCHSERSRGILYRSLHYGRDDRVCDIIQDVISSEVEKSLSDPSTSVGMTMYVVGMTKCVVGMTIATFRMTPKLLQNFIKLFRNNS